MTAFDPEHLLAALPTLPVHSPNPKAPRRFLEWRWPMVRVYNGFTPVERVQNWQIGRWLIAAGCLIVPHACSICGDTGKVGFHSENYYVLERSPALCGRCHMVLHRRFSCPGAWGDIVRTHVRTGEEWFALIANAPFDLAYYLRRTRGEHVADMGSSPALLACPSIANRMPRNLHGTERLGPDYHVQPDLFSTG